jgi:signal transduction histidine kinase
MDKQSFLRSLTFKLTLAFLFVGLTGAFLVALFVRQRTQSEFDRLILDQNQQALVANLTQYYQIHRTWEGVEAVFHPGQEFPPPESDPGPRWEVRRSLFAIANRQGMVVTGGGPDDLGRTLSQEDLQKGVALIVDNRTVGWLLFTPALDRWRPGTPEGNFLISVSQATIYSAIGAALVALLLGGFLAYTLTRSLRELTAATQRLAKGELGHQVKVRSKDEMGLLAASFNQMSAELARSNELRRRMTADIAHDLRNPLSVLLGYTEALSDGKLNPSPETFTVMHTEAQHLSRLIDDLKTLSLADAGELPLVPQQVNPGDLLRRAALVHQVEAEKREISIQVQAPAELPLIQVDVERMAQVLGNLMGNALRYTSTGGEIVLSAAAQVGEVALRVADNGAGIAPEDLPFVFERSFRGDKARVQANGETGLGLAIAKSLVEAHGGTISVESSLGKGTTFSIYFPAGP